MEIIIDLPFGFFPINNIIFLIIPLVTCILMSCTRVVEDKFWK